MAVTMKQIAELAGVTRNAVAAVLNNTTGSRVSPAKRQRIQEIAKELDYRPSFAAKALIKRKTGLLGFVCGDVSKPFSSELIVELSAEAEARGFMLLLLVKPMGREVDLEVVGKLLGDNMLDGLFLCGEVQAVADAVLERSNRCGTPLVMLNSRVEGVPCVHFDFKDGMEKAFRLFLQNGRSGIAFAGSATDCNKLSAYRECCKAFKLKPREFLYQDELRSVMAQGEALANAVPQPNALVATDYGMSLMANGIASKRIRIPEDLSVIAFNNTFQSLCFNPPLTSVSMDRKFMARKGMELMLARLESEPGALAPAAFVAPSELIWRDSVKPLKNS